MLKIQDSIAGIAALIFVCVLVFPVTVSSERTENTAMWGFTPSRNLVSDETNLPDKWDPKSGENIKWRAELGSQTYAGPVIKDGKVFVGTNNQALRSTKLTAHFYGSQRTPNFRQEGSTIGRNRVFARRRSLKAIVCTTSQIVAR